jgi:hypothetical protein
MLERKKTLNVFKDARDAFGSYDDFPVGQHGLDPMPHLSRNRIAQPAFVIVDADQVLIQMAGRGRLELRGHADHTLEPGDTVYIPARTPSRIVPDGEVVQIRLEQEPPARAALVWFCVCGRRLHVAELSGLRQRAAWAAVQAFNGDLALRTCGACSAVYPPADLGDIAWPQVADAIEHG